MYPDTNERSFPGAAASHSAEGSVGLAEHTPEALRHLKAQIRSGVPWQRAVLEAMGLWTLPREEYQGRTYRYLIQGEAFDWLLLAERLCAELDGAIPELEKEALLFSGRLPDTIDSDMFRDLMGITKYRAYLNFWYGVVVEEALQLSVEEDVRKRHLARCYADTEELIEEAYVHLYGSTRANLIDEFRKEAHIPRRQSFSLSDMKEFTYWVHKRRLKMWDPARVASDTQKGIRRLLQLEQATEAARERVTL